MAPIAPPLRADGREDRSFPSTPRSGDRAGRGGRDTGGDGAAGPGASYPDRAPSLLLQGVGEIARLSVVGDPFDPLRPLRAANAYAAGLQTLPGVAGWNAGTVIDRRG